ncbi:homeobox protein NANOG-like [Podarcis raffonei]|uniref:homeobox protein NANOG-like n=1 Tax=Podarcis raffonei TaxID=65483 RepID=UPI0023297C3E|nr:homeobox protein NANOG-like [Podarcis raffonei]
MSIPLALNASYRVYPTGVVAPADMGYDGYYWPSVKEEMEPGSCSGGFPAPEAVNGPEGKGPSNNPDLSPRSSSSGIFTYYTPDSAPSPNKPPPSPDLTSTPQRCKEESRGGKKSKNRTAFSQRQLQVLHHRFQMQKYLSPQQIRELASALGLTYKQIKTWFQNQRMKFKRTQKEAVWMRRGICQPQNGYLDINPSYHQGYAINDARNIQSLANAHENYASNPVGVNNQNYSSDHSQIYGSPQGLCPVVGEGEDGGFFGKAAGPCYGQQALGYIGQQRMNFCHSFSASLEYAAVKMEGGYPFPSVSATAPGTSVLQHYQTDPLANPRTPEQL